MLIAPTKATNIQVGGSVRTELGEIVIASTVRDSTRKVDIEIADPRQDVTSRDWHCTYRVDGTSTHRVRGTDRLSAIYAALIDIQTAAARFGSPDAARDVAGSGVPAVRRTGESGPAASAANIWEFGPPLGARAVETTSGPVVIVIGRPRLDPALQHTYLCPFRIADRTEAFGQGFDDVHAVMSAIRSVSAILGIPRDWPAPNYRTD
ncbi:DUF6968 family protein [Nocardia sp. NPDC059177]|uniref:DUF6968 family protein n=1 Tax=Nocardia sp. NPDC059177 TaxID=3346759 RepID=UPI00367C114F